MKLIIDSFCNKILKKSNYFFVSLGECKYIQFNKIWIWTFFCVWDNTSDNKHCTYDNNSKPSMNAHISRQSKITMRLLDICIIIKLPAASLEVYGLYEQGLVASLL